MGVEDCFDICQNVRKYVKSVGDLWWYNVYFIDFTPASHWPPTCAAICSAGTGEMRRNSLEERSL